MSAEAKSRDEPAGRVAEEPQQSGGVEVGPGPAEVSPQTCEERYPWVFENLYDVFYRTDMEGRVLHVSRSVEKAFGYTVEEVLNEYRLDDIWAYQEERERFREVLRRQGYVKDFELRARRRDGSVVWVSTSAVFYTDERGDILGVEGVARDITPQKEAEERARQYARDMEYLSRTALELVAFPAEGDIHKYMAERLKEVVGDPIVAVCSFDEKAGLLECRSVVGLGRLSRAVLKLIGRAPVGMRFPISEDAVEGLGEGHIVEVPGGLTELALGQIPQPVCKTIEKLLGVEAVHVLGVVREGRLLASAVMMRRNGAELRNKTTIETFASQASVALQRRASEEALRESERKHRELVENMSEVVYAVDLDGVVTYVSPAVESLLGYRPEEIIGRPLAEFVRPEDLPGVEKRIQSIFSGHLRTSEYQVPGKSGDPRWIRASTRPILKDGRGVGLQGTLVDITEQRRLEEEIGEASVRERRRIGRDLHDSLGQKLAGVAYMAKALEQKLAAKSLDEAAEAAKMTRLIDETVAQARSIVNVLNPVRPEPDGLMRALRNMASNVSNVYGISCVFEPRAPVLVGDETVSTHVFRIAQEAVNNAVKHGKANRIGIELEPAGEMATLTVRDDGVGLPEGWERARGTGLKTMRYRAGMIGGTLRVDRAGGGGTVVRCSFPRREPSGPADGADEGMRAIFDVAPDLAIIDISLGDGNGISLIKEVKARRADLPILVLTMHDDSTYAERAVKAGATGYVTKQEDPATVLMAIRRLLDGGAYISENLASAIVLTLISPGRKKAGSVVDVLSGREFEVFHMMGKGLGTREIAERLHRSPRTVQTHRERIKKSSAYEAQPIS